ncbi:NAD(P)H-hydrate epimerase [Aurantiacibacter zhengii]|uniref:Bifunctional NAD(P)H-hydrate repair enzyme n=1 Tax=Aurantiacibacter zhengii TaxID=2307003 RepID=A0A418NVT1_9SPHN|nr:NAD(P)H-hydrate epimerase [Aurantiacibacter zhengii]RIV88712.1 NAD(P)H-hydrate epimerase [Aurantiacibacter zhengii]
MTQAADQILTVAQMQAAEQALIDNGETVESLMERAGAGAADWIWRLAAGRPVTILCGPGNNGGDGYVIARVLQERGLSISVVAPMEPGSEAAKTARDTWGGQPVDTAHGEVFVDCLFGTGQSRPLSNELVGTMRTLAASHNLRVAVDLPSGVDSDSGALLNDNLPEYTLTIALGAWKRAHWLMPAMAVMGERRLFDIGVGPVEDAIQLARRPGLSPPDADAHKYSRGLVGIAGGDMAGAGILAARAAQHGGAGYVKLSSPHSHPDLPADLVHDDSGDIASLVSDERMGALLIGPGLGQTDTARRKLTEVLKSGIALVLDADALTLLRPEMEIAFPGTVLATPHEGELDRLCKAFGIVAEGKLAKAAALHESTGMTVLAKGPDNVLVGNEGTRFFPPTSSWLSAAGTGDVLAGLAASRMAGGRSAFHAAEEAVQIHAEAARIAGPAFSAVELVNAIPAAYAQFL